MRQRRITRRRAVGSRLREYETASDMEQRDKAARVRRRARRTSLAAARFLDEERTSR